MRENVAPVVLDEGRGDWRRLVPSPARRGRLVVLGAPAGLASRLARDGEAEQVAERLSGNRSVDLLALLAAGAVDLSAADRVAPGGVLYVEVLRTRRANTALTPRRLERALAERGLRTVEAYAVVPGFHLPRAWVPLHCPAAMTWHADTLHVPWRVRHLPPLLTARIAARAGRRVMGLVTKRFALTASPRQDGTGPSAALRACRAAGLAGPLAGVLLLRGGWHRTVALPFAPGASSPSAVVKIPDRLEVAEHTSRERDVLLALRQRIGAGLRATVPEPLGTGDLDGVPVYAESLVPGRPVARSTGSLAAGSARRRADLEAAVSWLCELHVQTAEGERRWARSDVETWIEKPWSEVAELEEVTGSLASLREISLRAASELVGRPFATVLQHRDFTPWNVLRRPAGIGVVDWEGARPGLPLTDLLHFLTHWAEQDAREMPGAAPVAAMRRVLGRSGDRTARAAVGALRMYLRRLPLDDAFVPLLLVQTWLELAGRHRAAPAHGERQAYAVESPNLSYLRALSDDAAVVFGR